MINNLKTLAFLLVVKLAVASLYTSSDDVVQLSSTNFDRLVTQSDNVWVVEFYANWCGHCKSLAPEYKKAATALKGVVKVGAIDCDENKDLASKYGVSGFPTLKIFTKSSHTPYNGERTAKAIAEAGLAQAKKKVKEQLEGKSSSGSSNGKSDSNDVIELTDSNFDKLVMQSEEPILVEFMAPWCGHCKNLAPEWAKAATELKGKVKLGVVDATVNTIIASKYGVQGYPTIKFFPAGKKSSSKVQDYDGGRTYQDIVNWANEKYIVSIPAPEVTEMTSEEIARTTCQDKPLCIVSILPHILDCQSECRNNYINILKEQADEFKQKQWGWLWSEAGAQLGVEEALELGGFGYPALSAVNLKKQKHSILRGAFSASGIHEFLRDLAYGKGQVIPLKGTELPKINEIDAWDGKDGEPIQEEDIDLSDVDLDEIKDEL